MPKAQEPVNVKSQEARTPRAEEPPPPGPENAGLAGTRDSGRTAPEEASSARAGESGAPELPAQPSASAPAGGGASKPVRLFGTVDFRGELKNLPKWERVLTQERSQPSFGPQEKERLTPAVAERWAKTRESLKGKPLMEQVKAVNFFFNQWPYKTDAINYGIEDYWATPAEFVRKSGDCEDYAIAKYYALRNLGVPASQMRVVALKDTIRNLGHAVLAVYIDGEAYILDNLTGLVMPHAKFSHYAPQYSVNEEYRWVHVKPVGK